MIATSLAAVARALAALLLLPACHVYEEPEDCTREAGEGVRVCLYQWVEPADEVDAGGCK